MHALSQGRKSFVVHTTRDSARIIGLLGFHATEINFTLMVRSPTSVPANLVNHAERFQIRDLSAQEHRDEIVRLDALAFGSPREAWIDALLRYGKTRFLGLARENKLRALVCLRPRRDGAECIDICGSETTEDLANLLLSVLAANSDIQLECFARTDSFLQGLLTANGFTVPDFFKEIGPLVEWHRGKAHTAGLKAQCLIWL
jgi:hypothetical protein